MMKFATNHPKEFYKPKSAWFIGFMQFTGGLFCEVACVLFLSTITETIFVIIKFIALGSIAKIDDFYATTLPEENKIKKNKGKAIMETKNHRRLYNECDERSCGVKFLSGVTKVIKIFYASVVFYFIPYVIILAPFAIEQDYTTTQTSATFDSHFEGLINNLGSIWQ
jgi:hypothetical protein